MFETPVVFIVFNRLDKSLQVFEKIRAIQPKQLFVIADGPRNKNEIESCLSCRKIIDKIDWECELHTNFSNRNLGCGIRISSGLDWVFLHVDRAIVLEDDCVPDLSFFTFCEELLEKYSLDERVATIGGTNFYDNKLKIEDSYLFSRKPTSWGWATWRRAWKWYDPDMREWPNLRDQKWLHSFLDAKSAELWNVLFQRMYQGQVDTWDYKFLFCLLAQNTLTVIPKVNLVTNIGFDETATHTKNRDSFYANYPARQMEFPLRHPAFFTPISQLEEVFFRLT